MKKKFSTSWKKSKQPRKQRKYRANAPLHLRHKMLSSMLNKDLRKKYGKKSLSIRKGDDVMVMKGRFKKKKGKIASVDLKRKRATIEGIQIKKKDGTKINVFFDSSNLQIMELNLDDKKRKIQKISKSKSGEEKKK